MPESFPTHLEHCRTSPRSSKLRRILAQMRVFSRPALQTWLAVLLVLVGWTIQPANAQSRGAAASAQGGPSLDQLFDAAIDKVDAADEFDALGWPPRGRFTLSQPLVDAYIEFNKDLWVKHGIVYLFTPTIMMQKGSQGGSQDFTANEQYQTLFAWRLLNKTRIGTGYFVFSNQHLSQLTKTSGVDFSKSLGVAYFTSDSPANTEIIKGLLWQHEFPGEFLTLIAGHDEISGIDNGCRYACDDTQSFFSSPLSSNPTRTLPGQGPMVSADVKLAEGVIVETGVSDASGDGNLNFSRVFNKGRLAYASALKLENPFKSVGDGVYKFTYYKVDSTGLRGTSAFQGASQGLSIQVDQDFGHLGVFAKYSRAFERKGSIQQFASGGLVWTNPFGYDEDWFGLGFGWVDPTASNTNDEYVAETFYRLQLTPFIQVTPAAMLVMNPSKNPDNNPEGVFSLRGRALF